MTKTRRVKLMSRTQWAAGENENMSIVMRRTWMSKLKKLLRDQRLFACKSCGHVDDDDIGAGGFWEQGTDRHGEDIYLCPACGIETQILRLK